MQRILQILVYYGTKSYTAITVNKNKFVSLKRSSTSTN